MTTALCKSTYLLKGNPQAFYCLLNISYHVNHDQSLGLVICCTCKETFILFNIYHEFINFL